MEVLNQKLDRAVEAAKIKPAPKLKEMQEVRARELKLLQDQKERAQKRQEMLKDHVLKDLNN